MIEGLPAPPGNVVLLTEVGSTMHGISVGTDDLDLMGLVIEPPEYVIGLKNWETSVHRTKPEGERSGPGDIDLTYHSLRKFMRLAVKGNPTILQVLWIDCNHMPKKTGGAMIFCDPMLHVALYALRERLISKHAGRAYLGYLTAQRMRLTGERGQKDVKRPELVEAYGYDTKFAAHAVRLGLQGCELLETGNLTLPIPPEEGRDDLIAIRKGQWPLTNVLAWIQNLETKLLQLTESSNVQPEPDHEAVDRFLIEEYMRHWNR